MSRTTFSNVLSSVVMVTLFLATERRVPHATSVSAVPVA